MVVAEGLSKKDKSPYSRCYIVREAKNGEYSYIDERDTYFSKQSRPVGSLVEVEQTEK
jgi:hypothetical protein